MVSPLALVALLLLGAPVRDGGVAPVRAPDAGAAHAAVPDAGAGEAGEAEPPPPPSLGANAFCAELTASAKRRAEELGRLAKEREALAKERADLEKLAKDVERARAQLREETDKLASFMDLAGDDAKRKAERPPPSEVAPLDPKAAGLRPAQGSSNPQLDALARTVKAMKPEQAADLVGQLDKPLAVALLTRMKPKDASAVIERLKPQQAAELFGLIAAEPGTKEPKR